jgi:signal transduction histidine kinase
MPAPSGGRWRGGAGLALALGLALLLALFWLSFRNTERLIADADWRRHTYQVIAEIRGLLGALIDVQTGERGYLLTGDESFLVPYEQGRAEVTVRLARLRGLTADNPRQQRRIAAFGPAASAEVDSLDRGVARQRARGAPAAGAAAAADLEGRRLMVGLRARLAEMEGEETRLLALRDRAMVGSVRRTNLSLLAGAAGAALLLLGAFLALRREIGQRRLAEQQTRRANTRLAAANGELEAFCYSVSHDLRAPLRAIDGFSLVLLEDAGERLAPADHETLARVRAAAQRMAGLIDDLLRLSRISRTEIEPRRVDLSAIAGAAVEELRGREPARRAVVEIQPDIEAAGDPGLLGVALENLLGNAWKFTRERPEARIAFGAERAAAGPTYFVRDNGAGFDMTYADKLFGAFQRLHSTSEFEGTGIGLATVARVVHLHGGRVWAEAEVGKGATFRFTLDGALGHAAGKEASA